MNNGSDNNSDKPSVRVFPSEIGSWEYCCVKWYFEKTRKNDNRPGNRKRGGR
jgi:hypothetical protein